MFRIHISRLKFPKFSPNAYRLAFVPLLRPIFNDSHSLQQTTYNHEVKLSNSNLSRRTQIYNELTIGSITGLFLGVIIGKFSTLIVSLTLSVYLLLQFLQSRNLIVIPWNYFFKFNRQSFDLNELVLTNFNFKLSFITSFLIACYNI